MSVGSRSPARADATPESEARGEQEFRDEVWANLRRNYLAHLAHGLLGQTGFRLIQAPTLIPTYVFMLSGSEFAVGVARGAQALGQCLSPILSASLIGHRRRVLPLGFLVGGTMRLQLLGLAFAGFFLTGTTGLIAVCTFLALFGFFMGMQGVIFNFLMGKVIPVERRGVLMGLRSTLAGLTTAAVGLYGGYLIDLNALGNGYAATFLVTFVLTSLGLAMLAFMREPESPVVLERSNVAGRLAEIRPLLRSDRNFAMYLVARALSSTGRMAVPFYFLFAREQVSGSELGIVTAAFVLAQSTMNLGWGLIADRRGFRFVFLLGIGIWIASTVVLLFDQSFEALLVVFALLGAGLGGWMMASQTLVLEFGEREDLPLRIAVANSTSEFMGVVGPVVGGAIAMTWSYLPVFALAIGFKLLALLVMVAFVREPRRLQR